MIPYWIWCVLRCFRLCVDIIFYLTRWCVHFSRLRSCLVENLNVYTGLNDSHFTVLTFTRLQKELYRGSCILLVLLLSCFYLLLFSNTSIMERVVGCSSCRIGGTGYRYRHPSITPIISHEIWHNDCIQPSINQSIDQTKNMIVRNSSREKRRTSFYNQSMDECLTFGLPDVLVCCIDSIMMRYIRACTTTRSTAYRN